MTNLQKSFFLSQEYGIGSIVSISRVSGGYSTLNYIIKTEVGNNIFLKEYGQEVNVDLIEFTESFFQELCFQ